MIGMTSLSALLSPMYSASVELSAISVWSWEPQNNGHPQYFTTNPCRDLAVLESVAAIDGSQLPLQSLSTYISNVALLSGFMINPWDRVPYKYRPSHLIACPCSTLGSALNRAHWCTAYAMSGRVLFSR